MKMKLLLLLPEKLRDTPKKKATKYISHFTSNIYTVATYVESNEYKVMVENLKRRERERMMSEVLAEVEKEREALLKVEREKLKKEIEEKRSVDEILAENQRRIDVGLICLDWSIAHEMLFSMSCVCCV